MTSVETSTRYHRTARRGLTLPDGLESPRAKLVYLFLEIADGATVEEIQHALDMKKITLYSLLDTLETRDLVERVDDRFVPVDA